MNTSLEPNNTKLLFFPLNVKLQAVSIKMWEVCIVWKGEITRSGKLWEYAYKMTWRRSQKYVTTLTMWAKFSSMRLLWIWMRICSVFMNNKSGCDEYDRQKRMWQDKQYNTDQSFYSHLECRSDTVFESFYFRRTVEGRMHSTRPLPPSFHPHNTRDPSGYVI